MEQNKEEFIKRIKEAMESIEGVNEKYKPIALIVQYRAEDKEFISDVHYA